MEKDTIIICMGSSCFARGNGKNLEIIEQYLFQKGIKDQVILKGTLCEGQCTKGPNILINGKMFNKVDPADMETILQMELRPGEAEENA